MEITTKLIYIIISVLSVFIGVISIIWGILQRKNNGRMLYNIQRENEALNYYLKTEIPKDSQERYLNNIYHFRTTNFDYENIENIFYELRKIRRDIQKSNEIKTNEIKELITNTTTNKDFDYKQFIYQISQMTNIQYLIELLNENKAEEFRYIKNVLADIVHTIRNPASGMSAIITILKMEEINEDFAEKLNDIEKLIEEIENNLNAYYQISHMEPFVLDGNKIQLKEEIVLRAKLLALSSGKKVNIEYDNMCDIVMEKNVAEILVLAITCILENSISFINDNGVIKIGLSTDNNILTIEISNDGPVVKEENLESIFNQGFSTRESSGRGLAIAKQAVENTLNGIISCENISADRGVKFSIIMETSNTNE